MPLEKILEIKAGGTVIARTDKEKNKLNEFNALIIQFNKCEFLFDPALADNDVNKFIMPVEEVTMGSVKLGIQKNKTTIVATHPGPSALYYYKKNLKYSDPKNWEEMLKKLVQTNELGIQGKIEKFNNLKELWLLHAEFSHHTSAGLIEAAKILHQLKKDLLREIRARVGDNSEYLENLKNYYRILCQKEYALTMSMQERWELAVKSKNPKNHDLLTELGKELLSIGIKIHVPDNKAWQSQSPINSDTYAQFAGYIGKCNKSISNTHHCAVRNPLECTLRKDALTKLLRINPEENYPPENNNNNNNNNNSNNNNNNNNNNANARVNANEQEVLTYKKFNNQYFLLPESLVKQKLIPHRPTRFGFGWLFPGHNFRYKFFLDHGRNELLQKLTFFKHFKVAYTYDLNLKPINDPDWQHLKAMQLSLKSAQDDAQKAFTKGLGSIFRGKSNQLLGKWKKILYTQQMFVFEQQIQFLEKILRLEFNKHLKFEPTYSKDNLKELLKEAQECLYGIENPSVSLKDRFLESIEHLNVIIENEDQYIAFEELEYQIKTFCQRPQEHDQNKPGLANEQKEALKKLCEDATELMSRTDNAQFIERIKGAIAPINTLLHDEEILQVLEDVAKAIKQKAEEGLEEQIQLLQDGAKALRPDGHTKTPPQPGLTKENEQKLKTLLENAQGYFDGLEVILDPKRFDEAKKIINKIFAKEISLINIENAEKQSQLLLSEHPFIVDIKREVLTYKSNHKEAPSLVVQLLKQLDIILKPQVSLQDQVAPQEQWNQIRKAIDDKISRVDEESEKDTHPLSYKNDTTDFTDILDKVLNAYPEMDNKNNNNNNNNSSSNNNNDNNNNNNNGNSTNNNNNNNVSPVVEQHVPAQSSPSQVGMFSHSNSPAAKQKDPTPPSVENTNRV